MTIPSYPEFVPLSLEHKETIDSLLAGAPSAISEHTFTNMFMWRNHYGYSLSAFEEGALLLAKPEDEEPFFMPPVGFANPHKAVTACLDHLQEIGSSRGVHRVEQQTADAFLRKDASLTLEPDRDNFDYVYLVDDLINLSGRKYHRKKNHLNKFVKSFNFDYRPLTEDLLEDCFQLIEEWCILRNCEESPSLAGEAQAIQEALKNMETLSFKGGALLVEGRLEAFSLGEPLNRNTAVIHIEKANGDIQGIYAAINQQFLEHEWSDFEFVNREQDLGEEGLRKAKESYLPDHYVEKCTVRRT
jgi:uncharacterized protein